MYYIITINKEFNINLLISVYTISSLATIYAFYTFYTSGVAGFGSPGVQLLPSPSLPSPP